MNSLVGQRLWKWMPYYPVGAVALIALDTVVIWGVAAWNSSRKTA